jgi:hypothetical protein
MARQDTRPAIRCRASWSSTTWQPQIVNGIDLATEWSVQDGKQCGLVSDFVDSVEAVLQGATPGDDLSEGLDRASRRRYR